MRLHCLGRDADKVSDPEMRQFLPFDQVTDVSLAASPASG